MAWGRPERKDEAGGSALAERVGDTRLERGLSARAVEALADDDQDPAPTAPLSFADEAEHLAFGLSRGLAVQVALGLDFEPWIFEGVKDARVGRAALAEDDTVRFAFENQRLGRSNRGAP